jgi:hypothetical protein
MTFGTKTTIPTVVGSGSGFAGDPARVSAVLTGFKARR